MLVCYEWWMSNLSRDCLSWGLRSWWSSELQRMAFGLKENRGRVYVVVTGTEWRSSSGAFLYEVDEWERQLELDTMLSSDDFRLDFFAFFWPSFYQSCSFSWVLAKFAHSRPTQAQQPKTHKLSVSTSRLNLGFLLGMRQILTSGTSSSLSVYS